MRLTNTTIALRVVMAQDWRYCVCMAQDEDEATGDTEDVAWQPHDSLEGIGRRVAHYRRLEGLSAQELANYAGLTRAVVANIETGRRSDLTVRELLALSEGLRVPPAALLFDVSRPFAPARWAQAKARDAELLDDFYRPKIINAIDWLSASDAEASDPAVAEFERDLEEVDAVVLYPFGHIITATYGPGGRNARALISAARSAERAADRFEGARRDVFLFVRLVWNHGEPEDAQFQAALEAGVASTSEVGKELVRLSDPDDAKAVEALLRECDAAARNLRDAMAQLSNLGADITRPSFGGSVRDVMNVVQSSPHETYAKMHEDATRLGGPIEPEEYPFSSPLHKGRGDRLEALRARFRLPRREGN